MGIPPEVAVACSALASEPPSGGGGAARARPGDFPPALVDQARAGDELALAELLTAARRATLRYCRARLSTYAGGAEVAEDVTQEVLLAVVDVLPRYADTGAPFAALLYAIAGNKVADAQRRFARTPFHVVEEVPDLPDRRTVGPEALLLLGHDVNVVLELLRRIPPEMGRAVYLGAQGYSAAEVGELMGITANLVRVRQNRGRAKLRELLDG